MQAFTQKPGHPLITAALKNNAISLSQTRFFSSSISRKKSTDTTIWSIPLTNRLGEKEEKMLFDTKIISFAMPKSWVKLNTGETTFARTIYSRELYEKLRGPVKKKILGSIDRMGILRDVFDASESGYVSVVAALELLEYYKNETAYIVWASIGGKLGKVENLLDSNESEEKFAAYARGIFAEIGQHVGWEKKSTDIHEDILLRSIILSLQGTYKDKAVVTKAQELFEKVVKDKKSIDTDIRGVVYAITAENGSTKEFGLLKDMYIKEDMSAEKNRIGTALCLFENPELAKEALAFSLSKHVRTQDIGRFLAVSFENKKAREVTWQFIKKHWDELLSKMEGLEMDWIINGAASVASTDLAKDIFDFFTKHPQPKLEKAMRQVSEQISSNLDWKKRDSQAIEKFLQKEV